MPTTTGSAWWPSAGRLGGLPRARVALAALSGMLGEQEFVAGSTLSLADVMIGPMFAMAAETPEWRELTAPHANLAAYYGRLSARTSFAATTWARVEGMAVSA